MKSISLRVKAILAAIVLCLSTALGVSAIGLQTIWQEFAAVDATSLDQGAKQADATIREIGQRMGAYSALLASDPQFADAVAMIDRPHIERIFENHFAILSANDPSVAVLEAADRNGRVVIRGHNPAKFGDDKSGEPSVREALQGQHHSALTISPTSHEAAWVSVRPLSDASGTIIGTINVGARLHANVAHEIKARSGLDVILVAAGKVTTATLEGEVPAPTEVIAAASTGEPVVASFMGRSSSQGPFQ